MTSGVWPPWKRLALALFDRCPTLVDRMLPTLAIEEQEKFLNDVEIAISMASDPNGSFLYPLSSEQELQIRKSISAFRQKIQP